MPALPQPIDPKTGKPYVANDAPDGYVPGTTKYDPMNRDTWSTFPATPPDNQPGAKMVPPPQTEIIDPPDNKPGAKMLPPPQTGTIYQSDYQSDSPSGGIDTTNLGFDPNRGTYGHTDPSAYAPKPPVDNTFYGANTPGMAGKGVRPSAMSGGAVTAGRPAPGGQAAPRTGGVLPQATAGGAPGAPAPGTPPPQGPSRFRQMANQPPGRRKGPGRGW